MPEFPKTGLMCQKCCLRVALLDDAQPDSMHELACGARHAGTDGYGVIPISLGSLRPRRKSPNPDMATPKSMAILRE